MPATKDTHLPPTYIKNVAIEISQDYQMDNTPFSVEKDETKHDFIGKESLIRKFLQFFHDGKKSPDGGGGKGVYLVTGFRGMGKTSFVNEVISRYKKETVDSNRYNSPLQQTDTETDIYTETNTNEKNSQDVEDIRAKTAVIKKQHNKNQSHTPQSNKNGASANSEQRAATPHIIPIHLTLTQTAPKELDILRLVAISAFDELKKYRIDETGYSGVVEETQGLIKTEKSWLLFSGICLFLPLLLVAKLADFKNFITLDHSYFTETPFALDRYKIIAAILFLGGLSFFLGSLARYLHLKRDEYKKRRDVTSADNRIRWLVERCFTEITEENNLDEEINVQGVIAKLTSPGKKRAKKYGLATVKEIEYELQRFLSLASKENLEFIFIFDELDKVEPSIVQADMNSELEVFEKNHSNGSFQNNLEDRKRAILNIISGLKNFFTTVDARFIFIAGHEMFDASLADIADRQSAVSSIFTYTFNIESLVRENTFDDNSSMNASLSAGVEKLLTAVVFREKSAEIKNPPKRIWEIIESFYKPLPQKEKAQLYFILENFITYLTYRGNGSPKKTIRIIHEFTEIRTDDYNSDADKMTRIFLKDSREGIPKKFLYFNFHNQYRIALLNHLYRPFLIQFGQSFKFQSDNIILSTPYLFDHLFKFHPFAFSHSNLELIPEMLSSNKTPSLKEHIKDIIEYLGANHIRNSEIGLFDYKFYSRTLNEISFISKMFDYESAAFNFTLDESHLVKLLINNKIKELRSIYSKFLSATQNSSHQIFSIAHLNGNLGDLHFFDQQFDDAIIAYSDAIRPISHFNIKEMNMRDFVTLVKNKLKLGLCFEKINSFEEALAFYSDTCQDARRFLFYRMTQCSHLNLSSHDDSKIIDETLFFTSSLNDIMQIVNQGFLAKIIIQEKMGLEGITVEKVSAALGDFLKICLELPKYNSSRNNLAITNVFLMAGKLNYFKNSPCVIAGNDAVKKNLPYETYDLLNGLSETYSDLLNNWPADSHIQNGIVRKPIMALYFYLLGLDELFKSRQIENNLIKNRILKQSKSGSLAFLLIQFIKEYIFNKPEDQRFTTLHYRYTASLLSNTGDCLLSMSTDAEKTSKRDLTQIFKIEMLSNTNSDIPFSDYLVESSETNQVSVADVIHLYYLAAQCFLKAGKAASAGFEFRKILNLLRHILTRNETYADLFIAVLNKHIVQPALDIAARNSGHSDIHMFKKAKEKINSGKMENGTVNNAFLLNNLSNNPETREPILFFEYIKMRSGAASPIDENTLANLISSHHSITTQYVRIFELDFYAKYIFKKELKDASEITATQKNNSVNYLFSVLSILKVIKTYGTDYMLGFSYCAEVHFRIAEFLQKIEDNNIKQQIKDRLDNLFEYHSYASLDHQFHYQMAKDYYEKAIQLHTTGAEYRKAIGNMIYLEDDFNDNAYHFGAAIDRFLMINNAFHKRMDQCSKALGKNSYGQSSNYVSWTTDS